jgi:hypothetical protein
LGTVNVTNMTSVDQRGGQCHQSAIREMLKEKFKESLLAL